MKIVLLGYMGSGKSTIGKLLATALKVRFVDLDDYIVKDEGSAINDIFSEKGEIYFRKKEAESLRTILTTDDNFVLAIGGGTPCYANNMHAISEATPNAIYLKVSIPALAKRLSTEKEARPLIKNTPDEELFEFIGKHLFERSFYYSQANHKVACDEKSPDVIVDEIKALLS